MGKEYVHLLKKLRDILAEKEKRKEKPEDPKNPTEKRAEKRLSSKFSLFSLYTMDKEVIFYGGILILILTALYLARGTIARVTGVKDLYASIMDSMSGKAFNTYTVPDNYFRP